MMWWIVAGSVMLLLGALTVHRANRPVNRFTHKNRRRDEDVALDEPVDEIAAYWGSAMPALDSPVVSSAPEVAVAAEVKPTVHTPAAAPRRRSVPRLEKATLAEQRLGESACRLGDSVLGSVIAESQMLPGTRGRATPEDLKIARQALRRYSPTRTFAHGAIVQRIGDDTYLYVDTLESGTDGSATFLGTLRELVGSAHLVMLLGRGAQSGDGRVHDAHIGPILDLFGVSPEYLLMVQEDGSIHNHIEERRHYVPARLEIAMLPDAFMEGMLIYAQERFDVGDPEAVLRTIGPVAGGLWSRVYRDADFGADVLARALNLLGAANRMVFCLDEAISCFESALQLLKDIEAYDVMPIVQGNLGQTLAAQARQHGGDAELLRLATRHLQAACRLDAEDLGIQRALVDVYLHRYQVEGSRSLLARAGHVLRQITESPDGTAEDQQLLSEVARLEDASLGPGRRVVRSTHEPQDQQHHEQPAHDSGTYDRRLTD